MRDRRRECIVKVEGGLYRQAAATAACVAVLIYISLWHLNIVDDDLNTVAHVHERRSERRAGLEGEGGAAGLVGVDGRTTERGE